MSWLAERRFRISVVAVVFLLLLLFIVMTFTGIQLLHDYDTRALTCSARMDCVWVHRYFSTFRVLGHVWSVLLLVAPAVAGLFWGVMAVRDLEASGVSSLEAPLARRRAIVGHLGTVIAFVLVLVTLLSVAVSWWQSPLDRLYGDRFGSFDVRGLVPVAYAAFGVTLGALAGVVMRRTAAAAAAMLVPFAAIRVVIDRLVRPNLFPRAVTTRRFHPPGLGGGQTVTTPHVERGAWVFGQQVTTGSGQVLAKPFGIGARGIYGITIHGQTAQVPGAPACRVLIPGASMRRPWHPSPAARVALHRCIDSLHLRQVVSYLPTSRYWPLQLSEAAIYVVLAVVIGVYCVSRASRRSGALTSVAETP